MRDKSERDALAEEVFVIALAVGSSSYGELWFQVIERIDHLRWADYLVRLTDNEPAVSVDALIVQLVLEVCGLMVEREEPLRDRITELETTIRNIRAGSYCTSIEVGGVKMPFSKYAQHEVDRALQGARKRGKNEDKS